MTEEFVGNRRHKTCTALANYHTNSFALTYGVNPEDLIEDWNLWYDRYEKLDDKELADEVYKMHTAIEFANKQLNFDDQAGDVLQQAKKFPF